MILFRRHCLAHLVSCPSQSNAGFPSPVAAAVEHFMAQCHTSAVMNLAHRAAVDVAEGASERLEKLMAEEKTRD